MILPDRTVLEATNLAENPQQFFEFEEGVLEGAIASWHTHPYGGANLSIADYWLFKSWPNLFHFIISEREVRCYTCCEKGVIFINENEDLLPRLLGGAGRP